MTTLKKIVTGMALVSTLAFGQCKAQVVPNKVNLETSIVSNKDMDGILMQRFETGNDAWTLKYDYHPKLGFDTKPVNAGMLSLNKLYDKNGNNAGLEGFQIGNFDGKDTWFVDGWFSRKNKDKSFMIDAGLGFPSNGYVQTYAIGTFKHPKTTLSGAFYKVSKDEMRYYGYAAVHDKNLYAAAGNNVKTTFALAGIYGKKDFGTLVYGTHNRQTGDAHIKAQTAVGEPNKNFFSVNTFNLAANILGMPMFLPIHLGPCSTKGNYALKLEYFRHGKTAHEYEVMLATKKIPFVELGIGINSLHSCDKTQSNIALELYKDVKMGKVTASAEARYNQRTHAMTGYLKMNYAF